MLEDAMQRTVGKLGRPFGQLHYEVTGSGPPLLFAHGLGGNHLSWWQQIPAFSKRFRCITFDHRAFGRTVDGDGEGKLGRRGVMDAGRVAERDRRMPVGGAVLTRFEYRQARVTVAPTTASGPPDPANLPHDAP